ncbi:hypothetical protein CHLRE_12g537611v5 [Chlamydomonas reinhardtii]|nr:uncharacterized protein CHLRE_12g537611v5 [Chlamydomonas reinhardtii]PNW75705.1 hypothetical protein CHLRE_12g537611v5 [Chlamydomonas reinhardtii]
MLAIAGLVAAACASVAFAQYDIVLDVVDALDPETEAALTRLDTAAFKTDVNLDDDGWTFVIGNLRFLPPNATEVTSWSEHVDGHVCDKVLVLAQAEDCRQVSIAHDGYSTAFIGVKLLNPLTVLGDIWDFSA